MRLALLLAAILVTAPALAATPAERADALFQAKDYAHAAEAYRAIVGAEPKNANATFRLALSLHLGGKPAEAIPMYTRARDLGVRNPVLGYNLACAYAITGDRAHALENVEGIVARGWDDAPGLENDQDLAPLRGDPRFTAAVALARKNKAPCRASSEYRQLDFWVGDWEVQDPTGRKIGESRVERMLGDCVVLENWTDARGRAGKSFNIYDAPSGKWRQIWVDDFGGLHEYSGSLAGNALVYRGNITNLSGKAVDTRMTFRPLDGGKVEQLIEQTADGGKTWTVAFDGIYVPRGHATLP